VQFSDEEIETFRTDYRPHFKQLYLHGSYWINLAGIKNNGYGSFVRELALAERLGFNHMVLHPGAATGGANRLEGIKAFAGMLNTIMTKESPVSLILENTAHGGKAIGSNLEDFALLLSMLEHPEKISFALDTGHAFVHGYDIATEVGLESFIALVATTIGLEKVVLIHLNDSIQICGSKIDQHALPGEGRIGIEMLKRFVMHPALVHVPIIIEPPQISQEQENAVLDMIRSWQ
jgi:deoxyribonuclease-4